MSESKPVFVLHMTADGQINFQSKLPPAELNLALDWVKAQLIGGKVQEATPLVAPANGADLAGLKARMTKP